MNRSLTRAISVFLMTLIVISSLPMGVSADIIEGLPQVANENQVSPLPSVETLETMHETVNSTSSVEPTIVNTPANVDSVTSEVTPSPTPSPTPSTVKLEEQTSPITNELCKVVFNGNGFQANNINLDVSPSESMDEIALVPEAGYVCPDTIIVNGAVLKGVNDAVYGITYDCLSGTISGIPSEKLTTIEANALVDNICVIANCTDTTANVLIDIGSSNQTIDGIVIKTGNNDYGSLVPFVGDIKNNKALFLLTGLSPDTTYTVQPKYHNNKLGKTFIFSTRSLQPTGIRSIWNGSILDVKGINNLQTTFGNGGWRLDKVLDSNVQSFISTYNLSQNVNEVTIALRNNGSSGVSNQKFAFHADVQIGSNDCAPISNIENQGFMMTDGVNKLYIINQGNGILNGMNPFGGTIDATTTKWWGYYSSRMSFLYNDLSGHPNLAGTDSGSAFSWQSISLEPGETRVYTFKIAAGSYNSDDLIDIEAPTEPTGLKVESKDTENIKISWTKSSDNNGVAGYKVYRDGVIIKTVTGTSFEDSGLTPGTRYTYTVKAYDLVGNTSNSSESLVVTTLIDNEAPSIISIEPTNASVIGKNTQIVVKATDNIKLKSIKLQYAVEGSEQWNDIETIDTLDIARFNLENLQVGGKISVRAIAYDKANNESENNIVRSYTRDIVGPEKIVNIIAESNSTNILLNWDDVSDNDFSYFQVERKNDNGTYTSIGTVSNARGMNVTGLKVSTAYTFRVVAYDRYGNRGIESDEIKVTTTSDTQAPQINGIQPQPGYFNTQIPLTFTVSDNVGVKSLTIQTSTDHTNWNEVTTLKPSEIQKTSYISYNLDVSMADEGSIYVRGIAQDEAGNSSKATNDATYIEYIIDRIAPSQPTGLKAAPTAGNILLSWNQNAEQDLASYVVYRSTTENGTYSIVSNNLSSLKYLDKDVVQGTVYYYKVSPVDHAGNEGPSTTSVSTKLLQDVEAPVVLNMTKAADGVLPANPTIRVQAVDNYRLASITLEYKNLDIANSNWKKIDTGSDLNTVTQVVPFTWSTAGLTDGNYSLRATAADINGNVSQPLLQDLKLNLQPPSKPVVSVEALGWKINLSWTKENESDLAGFKIYRSNTSGSSYQIIRETTGTNYSDELLTPGQCYYYVVEAVDRYGNAVRSDEVSAIPTDEDKINPLAEAGPDQVAAVGLGIMFDGTSSSDNDKINSYHWDFGDGQTGTLAQPEHTYAASGAYTVTLSVCDPAGNSATDELKVVVNDLKKVGTIEVKVVDEATEQPLYNSSVYVELPDGSNCKKTTDGQGFCSLVGPAGNYKVYAYKADYLPASLSSNVLIGQTTKVTVKLKSGKIVVGVLSVNRMSLEQIRDAGIDNTNSDNQYVYKFKVRLDFSDNPIENEVITNGCGYIYGGPVTIHDPSGSGAIAYLTAIPHENHPEVSPTIAYMTIPGQATWQKEFFEVSLVVQNMAETQFVLENSSVKLNKPDGLTIVKESNNGYAKSEYVDIGSIAGGQSKEVKWIIRGEAKGSYSLSADFNSTLMPFGDPVKATFVTKEPFRVWGDDALEMQIEGDDYAFAGDPYYIKVGLKNISDIPVNNVSLNLSPGKNFTFVDGQKTSITAEKIAPGETLENEYYLLPDKDGEDILHDVLLINMSDGINLKTTFKPIPAPLTGSVSISSTAKTTDVDGEYIIEVSVTAINRKGYTVKNAKVSIGFEPSNKVDFVDCISQQDLGDIEPTGFGSYPNTAVWKIKIKPGSGENKYTIKLWGDNARERTISGVLPNEYKIKNGYTGDFYYQAKNTKEKDYTATYYYDDDYFSKNASDYNTSLATMSLCFELSAWGSNVGGTTDYSHKYRNAEKLLGEIGFKSFETNDYFKEKPKEDSMGVVIASKDIEVNGKSYTLIALATRGGGYEAEWAGNFTVGASGQHEGFKTACDEAYRFLADYITRHKSEFKSDVKLWLAGYSRGGATVNMLAGRLDNERQIAGITIEKENLFAYCFEPPMGALEDQVLPASKYDNIHNIVNPSDPVPKVAPKKWGFTRYGKDQKVIPSKLNYSNSKDFDKMLEKFKELDTLWVHESLVKVDGQEKHIIDTFQAKKFDPNVKIDLGHWEEKTGWFGIKYWIYCPNFEVDARLISNDDMTTSGFLDNFILSLAVGLGDRVNYTQKLQGAARLAAAEFMGEHYESYKWDKAFDNFDKKIKDHTLDIAATYMWSGSSATENLVLEYLYESISEAGIDLAAYGSIPGALREALDVIVRTVVASICFNGGNDLLTLFSDGNYKKLFPAHYPELCLAWMQMQDINYTPEGKKLFAIDSYRILRINCPVDVSVYNSEGTLVAQFINDVPQKIKGSTIVSSFTSDGEKVVYLPADENYDVKILATGEGKLNYSVNEFSNDTESYAKIVNYYDIPIVAGDKLSGVVPKFSSEDTVNTGEGSKVKYALSSSAGELVPSKELLGKSAQEAVYAVRLESNNAEGGKVIGGGAYSEGSFAQVAAITYEKCEFVGWYENDTLISTNAVYRFQVKKDINLIAKFNGNRPSPTSGTYPLKIEAGLGGSITKGANGNYSDGSITPLKAIPNSGYRFKNWSSSNGGTFADATNASTTFTMPANFTTITANFEYIAPVVIPGDGDTHTPVVIPSGGGANVPPSTDEVKGGNLDGTIKELDPSKVPGAAVSKDIYVTKNLATGELFSSVPYLIENGRSTLIKWSSIVGNTVSFLIPKDGTYEFRDNKKVFNDISGHWAENTITAITSRELFSGIGKLKFDPNGGMTRAMFATVLSRLDEADLSNYRTSPFKDVAINDWFGASVAWATDKGILSGYGNGVFGPNERITREQMAVMLNNYLKYKGLTLPSKGSITPFADNEQISAWAKDAVGEMKRMGLIQGGGKNNYLPKGTADRASVAQIFMNVINAVVVSKSK